MSSTEIPHRPKRKSGQWCRCPACEPRYLAWLARNNELKKIQRKKAADERRRKRLDGAPLVKLLREENITNEIIKKHSNEIFSWGEKLGIDAYLADKICISIGLHPIEVFGEEWLIKALQEDTE
jgi:hypothetical protein